MFILLYVYMEEKKKEYKLKYLCGLEWLKPKWLILIHALSSKHSNTKTETASKRK